MVNYYTYLLLFLEDIHYSRSLNEFSKYFKKPHQTVKSHLHVLVASKILLIEKRERFLFYRLNLENPLIYEYLVMCEKERLVNFLKNELFNRLYLNLQPHFIDSKILLFGSVVNEKNYSDIDILVISKNKSIRDVMKKFELTYSVKIHLIMTDTLSKTFIKEIQKKHIIFNSHEYYVKMIYF